MHVPARHNLYSMTEAEAEVAVLRPSLLLRNRRAKRAPGRFFVRRRSRTRLFSSASESWRGIRENCRFCVQETRRQADSPSSQTNIQVYYAVDLQISPHSSSPNALRHRRAIEAQLKMG